MTTATAPITNHPTSRWQQLVTSAILGTDRTTPQPTDSPWSLPTPSNTTPNDLLLTELATLSIYQHAGFTSQTLSKTTVKIVPFESVEQTCSRKASQQLAQILQNKSEPLLIQWTDAANKSNLVAPPEALPNLLKNICSQTNSTFRQALIKLVGQRGQWLASQNPSWANAFTSQSEQDQLKLWEIGTHKQRLQILTTLNTTDPQKARQLIDETWKEESADHRASFIKTLEDNLIPSDADWLEQKLDDRSKQVKKNAASLLSTLPDSPLSKRMIDRLLNLITYVPPKGKLLKKKASLTVTLPDTNDDSMKLDSLEARRRLSLGNKASLLNQIVSLTPLSYFDSLESDPINLINIAHQTEWALALIDGWTQAAVTQNNPKWIHALLTTITLRSPVGSDPVNLSWRNEATTTLSKKLTPANASQLCTDMLSQYQKKIIHDHVDELILTCNFQWNDQLSLAIIPWLSSRLQDKSVNYDYALRHLLTETIPHYYSTSLAETLESKLPKQNEHWSANFEELITQCIDTIKFRRDMLNNLSTNQ
ncbi:hypothetical protein JD969_16850 [Planctomycetota bacterium]|nr:hypothetical protein JD969_16850 [Planctomycetota bacterium]